MNKSDIEKLAWEKMNNLLPAIVQNADTGEVLMLAYMNPEALEQSLQSREVTFYSRSKQALWKKGETSGNTLLLKSISSDCDGDSLLIQALPAGPACHLGFSSCFQPAMQSRFNFLASLINLIQERAKQGSKNSYTTQLIASGINRCAQKVGEEAVETVIAAVSNNQTELANEAADLFYHFLVLLQACQFSFYDLLNCLQTRHSQAQ